MAEIILICGRLCSGKSTYAQKLRKEKTAVILSCDEIMLALLDPYLGDSHEMYVARREKYLLDKAVEIASTGINVVLDWGFWSAEKRRSAKNFFHSKGLPAVLHYLDVADSEWRCRIEKRNSMVEKGESTAYYVDENLAAKFAAMFEKPTTDEIDLLVQE